MKECELTYEELQKFVNHLDDSEFNLLREVIYERLLEDIHEEQTTNISKTYQKKLNE